MPVMNGLEAVAWIRAREASAGREPCVVVMMSSNDDATSIRRGLAAGSNRYLTKPFSREALLAVLHALDTGSDVQVPLELEPAHSSQDEPVAADAPVRVDTELQQEVPAFLDSRRQMVEAMAAALATGNRADLRAVAHRAAGGLALFGFRWAAWQSRQISAAATAGEADVLKEGIARLREHLRDVQVA
jgi:CheY-like chemotaxis protein